jgi:squalene-associated FAD-dependent desaturase
VTDVIVIGGGLSGLASAVKLASEGLRAHLFEQSIRLGGRCYSYEDNTTGDVVDNGQHILLGAYHNLLNYLDLIGTRHLLMSQSNLRLPLYHPEKGFAEFKMKRLPKPFHLTAGLMSFPLLSMSDRRHMVGIGIELQRFDTKTEERLKDKSVDQWLTDQRQSINAKKNFWYPIAVSVMNELPERASALLFARSLNKAFFGTKSDSAILLPKVGQTQLYADAAVEYLRKRQCKVDINADVHSLICEVDRVVGVRLADGTVVKGGSTISAVPFHAVTKMLPQRLRTIEPFGMLSQFESSPIISLHMWFDSVFTGIDYVGCIDLNLQWIFNRRKIFGEPARRPLYLTAVISGAYRYINMQKDELIRLALNDINQIFPESRGVKLIHSVIIKEKRATFSAAPSVESLRPSSDTPLRGFYLAGDWTATGYPATIEGAVLSGFRAADMVKSG